MSEVSSSFYFQLQRRFLVTQIIRCWLMFYSMRGIFVSELFYLFFFFEYIMWHEIFTFIIWSQKPVYDASVVQGPRDLEKLGSFLSWTQALNLLSFLCHWCHCVLLKMKTGLPILQKKPRDSKSFIFPALHSFKQAQRGIAGVDWGLSYNYNQYLSHARFAK